mgnify:CR=1 FL=1
MKQKNRAMELYRFIGAVMILCYHCYWFAFRSERPGFLGFYLFVELFFILSGFLMMRSIRREKPGHPADMTLRYVQRRLKKIYPHHVLSFLLVLGIRFFLMRDLWPIDVFKVGWTELFLVNIFGYVRGEYINIVCWYLSAMLFASMVLHYLILRDEEGFMKIVAPILLLSCYGTLFDRGESLAVTILFTRYAPHMGFMRGLAGMTVGCLAYRTWEWLEGVEVPGEDVLATVLEAVVMLASALYMFSNSGKLDFMFPILFFAFVISVFRGKSLFTQLFDNRVSAWLGEQSFAYFLNNLVVVLPFMHFFPDASIWTMCLVCVPACLAVSVITGGLMNRLTGN